MVVLLVHPAADAQHDGHIRCHQQVEPDGGDGGLDDDLPEVPDEQVHRIQQEQALGRVAIAVNGVENGGHVHQQLGKHCPQILDVPEKHEQRRQNQAHADVEQHQEGNGIQQADQPPGERDVVQYAEHKEHAQRQAEIDEGLDVLGKQEQVLGHVDLGEDAGVAHQGSHPLAGGFVEVAEHQVAAEQIRGVMGRVPPEKLGEHQPHHQQHQQRRQHAPQHAQHRPLVFLFEVPLHQFLKEELVLLVFLNHTRSRSIPEIQVPGVYLVHHRLQLRAVPVGDDDLAGGLKFLPVPDHPAAEEHVLLQRGLIDDHLRALGLQTFHNALDAGLAEVVGVGLHGQAVHADDAGVAGGAVAPLSAGAVVPRLFQHPLGDEVLASAVGLHDGADDVIGHLVVVGQQLLGVLGQAVAAVAEGGVVVIAADAGVVADALDDLAGVQPPHLGVGVQLVEEGHPQCKVRVGEQLHRLRLRGAHQQHGDVLFDGAFLQQPREGLRRRGQALVLQRRAHDDAGRIQVVIQRPPLPQEFRGENNVVTVHFLPDRQSVSHRHRGFDDHDGLGVHRHDLPDDRLHGGGVKVVFHRVVVGGGGDDDVVRLPVGGLAVCGGSEAQRFGGQILLDLPVRQGGLPRVDEVHLFPHQVHRRHLVVLGEQYGVCQAHVTRACDCDFHCISP